MACGQTYAGAPRYGLLSGPDRPLTPRAEGEKEPWTEHAHSAHGFIGRTGA